MRLPSLSPPSSRLSQPAHWSRVLLAGSLTALGLCGHVVGQTYYNLATGNYAEDFSTIGTWSTPTTNSWSGVAVGGSAAIPDATKITTATLAFVSTGSSGGVQRPATNIALLSTGATSNTSSAAIDLNLNFTGRTTGNLTFDAAESNNSTGDRQGSLKVYYSTDGTTWTEITGTNLPFVATNNVASSATISVPIPSAVDNKSQVKLRFYYHNAPTGTTGSRPRITIDNVAVTSIASGAADTTPPQVTTLTPSNNATGVSGDANLVLAFNEIVSAGTGNILIKKVSDGSAVATIPVGDPTVTGFGTSTVTINPASNLADSTAYYVELASGVIKDVAGNSFPGFSGSSAWTFTTVVPDVSAPTLVSVSPMNGATGVNPSSPLTLTFSEAIQQPLFSGPEIRIKNAGGTVVTIDPSSFGSSGAVSVLGSVATITIPSTTPLEYGTTYYVEMDSGAFEDTSSNPYAGFSGSSTWSFTTLDVPSLNGTPYTQSFSTYVSAATLPVGWSAAGGPGYLSAYVGDWGSVSTGGFRGNNSVYGYHHTSASATTDIPLQQILTLRNTTGATLTDLTVSYKGRSEIPANTRIPAYTVSVGDAVVTGLAYSTADGDNVQRHASISGLSIANGATFQIKWSSAYPPGAGSAHQIGISDVSVSAGSSTFAPTVAGLSVPVPTITSSKVTANANVIADGGPALTARGFVYSVTSVNAAPELGGTGVLASVDGAPAVGSYTADLTGLNPATNYTIRGYATNSLGTSYTTAATFSTLAPSPTLVTTYTQEFDNYTGANPAGWTAISDAVPPVQSYAGVWGTTSSSGGFLGGVTGPGVLGYRHTGSTGNLTVTLHLVNGTGASLSSLYVSYLGRAKVSASAPEGRSPKWTVSITYGSTTTVVPGLYYDTASGADTTVAATLTGLAIPAGSEFTLSWASDRDLTGSGSSKQIGIAQVYVGLQSPDSGGYASWKTANAGGQGPTLDFDNDGVPNGVEYFFGATGSSFTPNPQPNAAGKISFPHPAATPGATYKVLTSGNLTTWTDVTASTAVEGGFITYTLPTGQGKLFVRLEVDVAP